jgi:thymidylate synthase
LKKDVYRKSAVAMTWIVEDELTRRYQRHDKNSPCIVLIQPNVQMDGYLHLTTYIRSNDMVKAWPQNAFGLRKLQKMIAEGLGLKVGNLITISQSAHIYDFDFDTVNKVLNEHYKDPWCKWDPKGYYVIKVDQNKLIVTHYSPDSKELEKIEGSSALELIEKLGKLEAATDPCHYLDLGSELRMAELCMKLDIPYKQDNYNYDSIRGALNEKS